MPLPLHYIVARFFYTPSEGKQNQLVNYYVPVENPGNVTLPDVQVFAGTLSNNVGDTLRETLPSEARYEGVNVAYHNGGLVLAASAFNQIGAGALAGDALPPHVAVCIRKRTGQGGRTGYGRWFVGCIAESQTNDARLSVEGLDLYEALADALKGTQNYPTGTQMVPHHLSRKDQTLLPIEGTVVDNVLRRQDRRRLRPAI